MARVRFGATSAIGREDDGAGAWIISPSLSGPPQHVLDRLPVPPPAARRPHPARVERLRDPVIGGDPAGPNALDDRQHLGSEAVCAGADGIAPEGRGLGRVRPVAEQGAGGLLPAERVAGPLRDQRALLLGERGEEVQHERVGVGAQLGDDERHALRHEAGDERHVARQPVELGHDDRALRLSGHGERGGQLGPAVEGVSALASSIMRFGDAVLVKNKAAAGQRACKINHISRTILPARPHGQEAVHRPTPQWSWGINSRFEAK